jgi:hypothetical protein
MSDDHAASRSSTEIGGFGWAAGNASVANGG